MSRPTSQWNVCLDWEWGWGAQSPFSRWWQEQCPSLASKMWGTAERGRKGRRGAVTLLLSTQQSGSSVTSTDRNRRTCGAGCVVLIQFVWSHTLAHMTEARTSRRGHRKDTEHMPVFPFFCHSHWHIHHQTVTDRHVWLAVTDVGGGGHLLWLSAWDCKRVNCAGEKKRWETTVLLRWEIIIKDYRVKKGTLQCSFGCTNTSCLKGSAPSGLFLLRTSRLCLRRVFLRKPLNF